MRVINLFGSPGTGKSTTAAGLFHIMKINGYSVELVTEYAKDLVWSERVRTFKDPLYILAKQNHRLNVLKDKVDYAITDSPLLLANIYSPKDYIIGFDMFTEFLFDSYENISFLLNRVKPYVKMGRNETAEQSAEIGKKIKNYLLDRKIFYIQMDADEKTPTKILTLIRELPNE